MRKLRVATFVSMDGVMQAPGGPEEDPTGGFAFGGWTAPHWDEALGDFMDEAMGEDYDLLLGRRTYEIFAAFWPQMDDEIGRKFNAIEKYVVAGPETPMTWVRSHRLEGDAAGAVAALKRTEGRDLLIQGSSELIHALLAADLIDELDDLGLPGHSGAGQAAVRRRIARWRVDDDADTAFDDRRGVSTYERAGEVETGSFAVGEPGDKELARRDRLAREG